LRVLAVDPGGTTGLAQWHDGEWYAWAEPWEESCATVHAKLHGDDLDWLVMESFHISTQTGKKSTKGSLQAIELIGIGRYLARVYGVGFDTQTPSEAKMYGTDAKLRAMGWWSKGLDHPRDASRHLLTFLCEHRLIDVVDLRRKLG
jgi:hypothetical protein